MPCPPAYFATARRRRFQWLFVRIEVELRKIQAYRPEVGVLVPLAGHPLPARPGLGLGGPHHGSPDKGGRVLDASLELSEKL